MGLGLYVDGKRYAGWAYSVFNKFRERVAKHIGIDLRKMDGFSDVDKSILSAQGWEAYHAACEADTDKISWDTVNDPIKGLLHHSDCEGEIPAEECAAIADRLEQIIEKWPTRQKLKTDPFWQERGYPPELDLEDYDTAQAKGLIEGLREAAKTGKPLEFC